MTFFIVEFITQKDILNRLYSSSYPLFIFGRQFCQCCVRVTIINVPAKFITKSLMVNNLIQLLRINLF